MPKPQPPLESAFSKDVVGFLKGLGIWHLRMQMEYHAGIPDFFGCVKGTLLALEIKRSESKISDTRRALQRHTLRELRRAGAYAVQVYPENFLQVQEDITLILEHPECWRNFTQADIADIPR